MAAADSTDFQAYLESICSDEKYLGWQDFYTPTDALHGQRSEKKQPPRRLNLSLMVQTIPSPEEKAETEKVERLEVLAGLRKYAENHLLLVGKPGSGKSTALERLLWEEAEKARQNQTPPPNPLPDDGEGGQKIPVLVELRRYKTSVLGIIGDFLFQHGCRLNEAEIEQVLLAGRFLLLVDGWNELPDDKARKDVKRFREKYQRLTPMIFTTRELAGDIGIEKKLEMQPLTEPQMRQFVLTYLPEEGERLLQQLQGRLPELGETPLLLWMLCELFNSTGNIPPNLGLVFRCFTQSYDSQIKQDVSTDESRSRWFLLLQHLAFEMMRGKTATDLRVTITKQEAEDILTDLLAKNKFDKPRERAFYWLNDLLKYHLIQLTNSNREIEFHHQLLQEYYAAEKLLLQLPKLSDDTLKRDYLNYLKWTEPLALMLALLEDEEQALRVVKLALEVNLRLGARLAGEVKPEFQEKTVDLVVKLEIPPSLKVEFLDVTHSEKAASALVQALREQDSDVCISAVEALGKIGNQQAVDALVQALNYINYDVCISAAEALGKIGNQQAVDALVQALNHQNYDVPEITVGLLLNNDNMWRAYNLALEWNYRSFYLRKRAAEALGKIGSQQAVDALVQALNHQNYDVSKSAAEALGKIGSQQSVPDLIQTLNYQNYDVSISAAKASGKIGNQQAVPDLIQALKERDSYVRSSAAKALGKIGSQQAVPALVQALKERNSDVRSSAAIALGKIGSPELLPHLTAYLKTKNGLLDWIPTVRAILHHLTQYMKTGNTLNALPTIIGIQNRCKYYNYEIYTSPAPEKQKPENPIIDTLNTLNQTLKTMSETPTNDFRGASFSNFGSVTGNSQGDVNNIGTQYNYAPKQNIAESAAEIQQLLEQLAKNNQTIVQSDNQAVVVSAIHEEIKRNPTIKARLWNALKAGGTEALKQALDAIFKNPAVSISVETIKGFIEAE